MKNRCKGIKQSDYWEVGKSAPNGFLSTLCPAFSQICVREHWCVTGRPADQQSDRDKKNVKNFWEQKAWRGYSHEHVGMWKETFILKRFQFVLLFAVSICTATQPLTGLKGEKKKEIRGCHTWGNVKFETSRVTFSERTSSFHKPSYSLRRKRAHCKGERLCGRWDSYWRQSLLDWKHPFFFLYIVWEGLRGKQNKSLVFTVQFKGGRSCIRSAFWHYSKH